MWVVRKLGMRVFGFGVRELGVRAWDAGKGFRGGRVFAGGWLEITVRA